MTNRDVPSMTTEELALVEEEVVGALGESWALAHLDRNRDRVWILRPGRDPYEYQPQLPRPLGMMAIDLLGDEVAMVVTPSRRHQSPIKAPCQGNDCAQCTTCTSDDECSAGEQCYMANGLLIGSCIIPERNTCAGGLGFHTTLEGFWLRSGDREYRSEVYLPEEIRTDCDLGFNPEASRPLQIEDLHIDASATGSA